MTSPNRSRTNALALVVALVAAILPLTASSASAAPISDELVVAAGHVDVGSYNLMYSPTRTLIESSTFASAVGVSSVRVKSETATVTDAYLSDVHIFFDGWVRDPGTGGTEWTAEELTRLSDWVNAGGVLITNEDSPDADALIAEFGVESGPGYCTNDAISEPPVICSRYSASALADPIVDGPFGAWATLQTRGTVGHFGSAPLPDGSTDGWTVVAEDESGNATIAYAAVGEGMVILSGDEGIWEMDNDGSLEGTSTDNEIAAANIFAFARTYTDDTWFRVTSPDDVTTPIDHPISTITLETNGGPAADDVTWDQSTLPAGLVLNGNTIEGTPTTLETVDVTVTASATGYPDATASVRFTIVPDIEPETTDDLVSAAVDSYFEYNLCANDTVGNEPVSAVTILDPSVLSDVGILQFGCRLFGPASGPSSATVDYTITDFDGDVSAPATITLDISAGNRVPVAVDDLVTGTVGAPVSANICRNDSLGDRPTSVTAIGTLPDGLAQDGPSLGCEISGTPLSPFSGDVDYTLTDDDGDEDTGTITFAIDAPTPPAGTLLAVDDVAIGRVGEAFSFNVCTNDTRDPGDDVVALDGLPAGLAYGGVGNCILSGTPETAGQSLHNYRLLSGAETSDAQIAFFIDAALPASLACAPSGGFSLSGATPGKANAGDRFGAALAAGDFDNDGNIDLAVGAPDDRNGRGSVTVFSSPCGQSDARRFTQAGSVPGKNEVNDRFGYSLAVGDFNRDNYDDLAIGVPYEDVAGKRNAGAVVVLYGSADGLSKTGGDLFTQRGAVPGANERHDKFGYALGAGDFDNDKRDDLLIGVPGETVSGEKRAGGVVMLLGSNRGLQTTGAKVWTQKGPLRGGSQMGDRLGYAIAVGDFDNDNFDDAAIGAPYEDRGSLKNIGAVHVLLGGSTGLSTNDQQFFRGNSAAHRLGWRLAAGETTGDAFDDLAAGARAASSRGMVHLFAGAGAGLSLSDSIDQTTSSASSPSNGDRFGSALAIVDHDGDGTGEVAIGVAREDFPGTTNAGAVHIVPVTAAGDFDQMLERFRTQANDDVAGVLRGGSMFGAALAAADGILFVGAPGDRAGSVDGAGTAAAVTPTMADTVHVPVGESAVGSTVPVGSYRSRVPTGTCAITTRTASDAIRSVMVAKDGSGYLQVTPDDNEVSVSAGCTGVWFLTPR